MAALKTDYKDAVYTGSRKYTQTNNTDGTVSLVDATAYSTEGDTFGATDINATNQAVNANSTNISALQQTIKTTTKNITLTAASWSSGSYTISDSLITASSIQEIIPATNISADQYKALVKASLVATGQSAGSITIKAFGATPTIDIPITVIFRGEK